MSLQKWKKKKVKALADGKLEDIYHTCIELAELYFNEENYEDALREYKEAEIAASADDNTINVAVSHRMIGQVYSSMEEHALAIKHQLNYLELSRRLYDDVEEQRALATLGQTYYHKAVSFTNPQSTEKAEALEHAKKYWMKSLQLCERLTDVKPKEHMEMKGRLYLNLGLVMEEQNLIDRAVDYLHKAVYVCKSMDSWDILYRSYHSLVSLYHKQHNHSLALQNCDKALDVAQKFPDNTRLCELLVLKGEVLFDLPDFRGSKQVLLKAYKLGTKNRGEVEKKLRIVAAINKFEEQLLETPDQDLVTRKSLYESMGDGCAAMKNFAKALEYYFLMLKTAEDLGESGEKLKPCYFSLSQTYKDNKQYDLAIEYCNREFQLYTNNPAEACRTTLNIADVLEIKEASVDEIVTMYKKALALAEEAGDFKLQQATLACIVRVYNENSMQSTAVEFEVKMKKLEEKMRAVTTSNSESEDEENTPDIGADICLDTLTDTEVDEEGGTVRAAKKKRTAFHFKRNEKGETPLHTACINGNLTLVQKLLDQGHPVDIRDNSGWLPLHEACNFGHSEIVELLLDRGASINDRGTAVCGGTTPLLDAASCGNLSVMKILLERGASPVMRTNKGETVLDSLTAWRERYKREVHQDLDSATLCRYHEMVQMLRAAIEKAGHKPMGQIFENNTLSQRSNRRMPERRYSDSSPSSSSISKRRSTESNQLRRSVEGRSKERRSGESSDRENATPEFKNAASEYENAIKALRFRPTPQTQIYSKHEEKTALINHDEVVDNWLIDDMELTGRGVKRRRGHIFEGQQVKKSQNRDHSQDYIEQSLRKSNGGRSCNFRAISPVGSSSESDTEITRPNRNEPLRIDSEDSFSRNLAQLANAIEADAKRSDHDITTSQLHGNENTSVVRCNNLSLLRKRQVSLLSAGVSRQTTTRHTEHDQVNTSTPLPSQNQSNRISPPAASQPQLVPCQSVKVRIEQKLFLVPLPSNQDSPLTVAWLAKEAARRYYSLEGVEPKLSLSTEDGALLAPDDPVTLLLSASEVHASVSAWNLAPLTQRYREACASLQIDLDDHIEWSLDACQATTSLDLADCALLPVQLKPAIKALTHHYALQHLNFSGNQLGDEGVQMLSECVMKLSQLRQLDLGCNGITLEGFSHLAQQASQHRGLQNLEILDFSHNPLGEDCLRPLGQILKCASGLTTLYLASVDITSASFRGCPELSLDCIEKLDFSYNQLDREGSDALLSRLEPSRLIELKLASTGHNIVREVALFFEQRVPYNLQTLDLSYCNANDEDIVQLVRSLQHANQLQCLEINGNKVSNATTLSEIYKLPISMLSMAGVEISSVQPDPPILQFSCLSLIPQSWGCRGPFGLVTTDTTAK